MSDDGFKGKFVWYDLMTTDQQGAQDFYTGLIGWSTQVWENGPMKYTMWTVDSTVDGKSVSAPVGGIMDLPEEARKAGAPPNWIGYIAVPDVDATVKSAEATGAGVIVPGTDIPEIGKFAMLADPQGAAFAIFTPLPGSSNPVLDSGPGVVSWHELATEDLEAGWGFYSDLFGWTVTDEMDMGEDMGVYRMYGLGKTTLGGMFKRPPQMPVSAWLYYITVGDLDEAVTKVADLGGKLINGPMEVPGGDRIAQCLDPQGGAFALHAKAS